MSSLEFHLFGSAYVPMQGKHQDISGETCVIIVCATRSFPLDRQIARERFDALDAVRDFQEPFFRVPLGYNAEEAPSLFLRLWSKAAYISSIRTG